MRECVESDDEDKRSKAGLYPAPLRLDVGKYRSRVDQFDITEEQKVELLQTLWRIMRDLALLGYGVDSINRLVPELDVLKQESEGGSAGDEFNGAARPQQGGKETSE